MLERREPAILRGKDNYPLHITLFLLTYLSATYAGLGFTSTVPIETVGDLVANLYRGLPFSTMLMIFLSAHEFGHYFAARYHNVDVTLPYYVPMPFFLFGTLGAVIRTREVVPSRRAIFDIGLAGPLAGFVVALVYLIIGIVTMPGAESLHAFHPEYATLPALPETGLHFGDFPLFAALRELFLSPGRFFPPLNEIYHYPFLAIGWFGMFVTALNMIPVGQLDGGHIVYGMFGRHQVTISRWFVRLLVVVGLGGVAALLLDATRNYDPSPVMQTAQEILGPPLEWVSRNAGWWFTGWTGWLFWVLILRLVVKIPHPPCPDETPLTRGRMIVGWLSLLILVLTISFTGIYFK